jgi:hypothetical protein
MFTEATDECRQYILSRAPTARITRSQAVDLDKKWICLIVNVNINQSKTTKKRKPSEDKNHQENK